MSQIDCLDCKIVISNTSGTLGGPITFTDPFTGLSNTVSYPYFEPGEVAKYDNLFWIKCPYFPTPNNPFAGGEQIKRFVITESDCTLGHADTGPTSVIWTPNNNPLGITSTGKGMCAKNASTVIIGSVSLNLGSDWLCEVDVSGSVAVVTPLFQAGGFVNGDIVYIPSSNTIVATIDVGSGSTFAIHYDMSGNVLGQSSLNLIGTNPDSVFSQDDDVYICTNNNIFKFDLSSYTLNPSILSNVGANIMDVGSHPECYTKDFCYEIGDITNTTNGGAGGIVFATPFTGLNQTPFYYEVAFDDVATGTTPINTVFTDDSFPFSQLTSLEGKVQCGEEIFAGSLSAPIYKPWDLLGAEFGSYGDGLTIPTSTDFGTGDTNTQSILNQPALPTFPTHDIAAFLCANYIFGGKKDWFLPSLMEFHLLVTNLGPGTPFENDLNLDTDFSRLQNTYWTSSEVNGVITNPLFPNLSLQYIGGPDNFKSDPFSWGYTAVNPNPPYSANTFTPGPHVFARCNTLSVRAIRKFECVEPEPTPIIPFNWVDDVQFRRNKNEQEYDLTTGISLAGSSGSRYSKYGMITGPSRVAPSLDPSTWVTSEYEFDATIGFDEFEISFSTTDVAGNEYTVNDFSDFNNPEGYTFKIYTADKIFLGEWHYQNCEVVPWFGQGYQPNNFALVTFGSISAGGFANAPWFSSKVFPSRVFLKFTNVTHTAGDYPIVAYGFHDTGWGQDEVRAKKIDDSNCNDAVYVVPHPNTLLMGYTRSHWPYIPGPKFHYAYDNEYEEGTFQANTASYAFIHFSCKMSDAKTIPLPDMNNGPNTTVNGKNVICLKEPFDDIKQTPGQSFLAEKTSGHIGTSWPFNRFFGDNCQNQNSGYNAFQNFNIYSNYALSGSNPPITLGLTGAGTGIGVAAVKNLNEPDFPKHFLWTWHAVFDPNQFTNNQTPIHENLLEGLDSGCSHGCAYEVGDTGPAGGIICAVPFMNLNDSANNIIGPVVPPLQGNAVLVNPTRFYYEISPANLNIPSNPPNYYSSPQWGSQDPINSIDINVAFDPNYTSLWTPDTSAYDYQSTGVNLLNYPSGPLNDGWEMEQVGQGKTIHDEMIAINNGDPVLDLSPFGQAGDYYNAFEACENYSLNNFDDWFLPNVREMEFARNYTPPGTLYNSLGFFSASIVWNTGSSETSYWTSNTSKGFPNSTYWPQNYTSGSQFPMTAAQSTFHENSGGTAYVPPGYQFVSYASGSYEFYTGYVVASDPLIETNPISNPIGPGWRTPSNRHNSHNIRAMRRFYCPTPAVVGAEKYTWSLCAYKDANGIIGFFSNPWVAGSIYDQGPVSMDNIGSPPPFGDDWTNDVQSVLGVSLTQGQVVGVEFLFPLPNGIKELYIQFAGLSLPWDEKLEITGLLSNAQGAPVNTVTYSLYPNCGSATGQAIVDPNDTSTARLPEPEITFKKKVTITENIDEEQNNRNRNTIEINRENKNIIRRNEQDNQQTY